MPRKSKKCTLEIKPFLTTAAVRFRNSFPRAATWPRNCSHVWAIHPIPSLPQWAEEEDHLPHPSRSEKPYPHLPISLHRWQRALGQWDRLCPAQRIPPWGWAAPAQGAAGAVARPFPVPASHLHWHPSAFVRFLWTLMVLMYFSHSWPL